MRVSQALSKSRQIAVEFEEDSLSVTYRPISYTLEEVDRIQADTTATGGTESERQARMNRVAEMISRLVVDWDLVDEDDVKISTKDLAALRKIPFNVFSEIIRAVRDDQQVGEAQRPSADI